MLSWSQRCILAAEDRQCTVGNSETVNVLWFVSVAKCVIVVFWNYTRERQTQSTAAAARCRLDLHSKRHRLHPSDCRPPLTERRYVRVIPCYLSVLAGLCRARWPAVA